MHFKKGRNRRSQNIVRINMRTSKHIPPFFSTLIVAILSFSCSTTDISEPVKPSENLDTSPIRNTNGAKTLDYLALGDSYTAGAGVTKKESFPYQLSNRLQAELGTAVRPHIIATSGWRTDDLLDTLDRQETDPPYDLVTLLIGVNNQYQGVSFSKYEADFPMLLNKAIAMAGGRADRVVVISIPNWAYTPFGQGFDTEKITLEIDMYNQFAQSIATANKVSFVNITDITTQGLEAPELVTTDNLHPSGIAYGTFVERIVPSILPALKN